MAEAHTPDTATEPERRLLFFGDPMCSWCWGFAPVLRAIAETYGDRAAVRIVVGGLRAGETQPMDAKSKDYVRHHWEQVHASTGQPFSFDFFDREDFVYDTAPACRAVVTMRNLMRSAALDYFEALHRAFYVDGLDTTDPDALADAAVPLGADRDVFLGLYASDAIGQSMIADFRLSQSLGVPGFPTIVMQKDRDLALLTSGYAPLDALTPRLDDWLTH